MKKQVKYGVLVVGAGALVLAVQSAAVAKVTMAERYRVNQIEADQVQLAPASSATTLRVGPHAAATLADLTLHERVRFQMLRLPSIHQERVWYKMLRLPSISQERVRFQMLRLPSIHQERVKFACLRLPQFKQERVKFMSLRLPQFKQERVKFMSLRLPQFKQERVKFKVLEGKSVWEE